MNKGIQEVLIYIVIAASALFIMGYAVHMIVGGLVDGDTEFRVIVVVCGIGVVAMAFMAWDVVKRRRAGDDSGGGD